MRIRNKKNRIEQEVYAIAVSTGDNYNFKERTMFYVSTEGMFGLGAEQLDEVEIIDSNVGPDFHFEIMSSTKGFMIIWNHFSNIEQLARLIELDPKTVGDFEKARAARSI